jgi:hypothetical protein
MRCRGKLCCCEREGEVAGKEDPVAGAAAVVVVVVVVVRDGIERRACWVTRLGEWQQQQ